MSTIAEIMASMSDADQAEAIKYLLSRNDLGTLAFNALCAHRVSCPNEYIILHPRRTHVLLFRRPADDKFFANQWHYSGTTLHRHQLETSIFSSVKSKYKLDDVRLGGPYHIGWYDVPMGPQEMGGNPRGEERAKIHVALFLEGEKPASSEWFELSHLPGNTIAHHRLVIREILLPWLRNSY